MKPSDWERLRPLLEGLSERPPAEHDAWLARVCDDPALRARARRMWERDQDDEAFLEPTAVGAAPTNHPPAAPHAGDRVGPWRLVDRLGAGGMGEVWRAARDDGAFTREVALKLLLAPFVSTDARSRFAREREVLGRLSHPGVAPIVDGGETDDGRPWLAMELIDGLPLDRWVADTSPSLDARLELFVSLCAGVAAAHAALVVHRDLKPANILVAGDGAPRLVDFGIARPLDVAPTTGAHERLFTPGYAAPEQVRGEPVTAATDVYALGVVLYELLGDRPPHDLSDTSVLEAARRVTETDPPPPSTVAPPARRRRLRGDLDTIVARAMHRDPARRYPSADALAADVVRHRQGLPVHARPDTLGYRAGRFVTRHLVGLSLTAGVILVLASSVVVILGLLDETRAARDAADDQRREADARGDTLRDLSGVLLADVYDAVEQLAGATKARAGLLDAAVTALNRLTDDAEGETGDLLTLGGAWLRLGDLSGRPGAAGGMAFDGAIAAYDRGLALVARAREAGAGAEADHLARELAAKRATVDLHRGRTDEAADALEALLRDVGPQASADVRGSLQRRLADARRAQGDSAAALVLLDAAVATLDGAPGEATDARTRELASALDARGRLLRATARPAAAEASFARAVGLARRRALDLPDDGQAQRDLLLVLGEVVALFAELGRTGDAAAYADEQLALALGLVERDPGDLTARADLAVAHEKRAELRRAAGDAEGLLADARASVRLHEQLAAADAGGDTVAGRIAHARMLASDALVALGRGIEAGEEARAAAAVFQSLIARGLDRVDDRRDLVMARVRLGELALEQDPAEALGQFERAEAVVRPLAERDVDHGWTQRMRMVVGYFVAYATAERGRDEGRATEDRRADLIAARDGFGETLTRSARLVERGMAQSGDAAMDSVLRDLIEQLGAELAALDGAAAGAPD